MAKVKGDRVLLDGNHPLAGKALRFSLKVTEVCAATPEEVAHQHVHGAHGHHHWKSLLSGEPTARQGPGPGRQGRRRRREFGCFADARVARGALRFAWPEQGAFSFFF